MHDEGEALLAAFNSLLPTAAPDRRDKALRIAIAALVHEPRSRLGNRSPSITAADQSSIQRALLPAGPAPGRAIADLLGKWLSDQTDGANAPAVTPKPTNFPASDHASGGANVPVRVGNGSAPAAVAKPSHDRASPLPAYRLTQQQREQLAAFIALDPDTLRQRAEVTLDLAQRAAAGQSLAPEVVERFATFLAAPE